MKKKHYEYGFPVQTYQGSSLLRGGSKFKRKGQNQWKFLCKSSNTSVNLSARQSRGLSNVNVSTDSILYTSATESPSICTWTIGEACLRLVPLSLSLSSLPGSRSLLIVIRACPRREYGDGFQCADDSHLWASGGGSGRAVRAGRGECPGSSPETGGVKVRENKRWLTLRAHQHLLLWAQSVPCSVR